MIRVSGVTWFTNIEIPKRHEDLILYKTYNPEEYPKYDNYDAINVDKTANIPMDYDGLWVYLLRFYINTILINLKLLDFEYGCDRKPKYGLGSILNGKGKLSRILIRRRQTNPKPISYEIGKLPVSMAAEAIAP